MYMYIHVYVHVYHTYMYIYICAQILSHNILKCFPENLGTRILPQKQPRPLSAAMWRLRACL